jgi:ATP-dependent helicase/nuclease subunit B
MLNNDVKFIENLTAQNQLLSLVALEQELTAPLDIHVNGNVTRIFMKGTMDRIDTFGGKMRIIDYKNSVKDTDRFLFESFEKLFQDKNYNKALQLMIYAWLLYKNNLCSADKLLPGIIPFKVFNEEPKYILGADKKPLLFTDQFLQEFEQELIGFIESVFDTSIPFQQTDDDLAHEFCPYNTICNLQR